MKLSFWKILNGVKTMRKMKKRSFKELVNENKQELLRDREALARIEERLEQRAQKKLV